MAHSVKSVLPSLTNNPATKIAGETFWINLPMNLSIGYTDLCAHLATAGLDPKIARQLASTYAFNRGVAALARGKLRDRVEWSQDKVTIQVSGRVLVPDGIDYDREYTVTLDRVSGAIVCKDPVVQAAAEAAFNLALGTRKSNDVTRLVRRLIEPRVNVGIFPMKGGVFFALVGDLPLVDQLEQFVKLIGGTVTRWQIADGTPQTTSQVQTVVTDSLQEEIAKVLGAIEGINSQSQIAAVKRRHEEIVDLYDKLRGARNLVCDNINILVDHVAYLESLLQQRVIAPPPAPDDQEEGDEDDQEDSEESTGSQSIPPPLFATDEEIPVEIGDASQLNYNPNPALGLHD